MTLPATGSQTVGPFFRIGLSQLDRTEIAGPAVSGEQITIRGRLLDGDDAPIPDGQIEIWQADSFGKYAQPEDKQENQEDGNFKGFGRIPTDEKGEFRFTTIKPGRVPGPNETLQAPHIVVLVFMRGLLRHLVTRIYFPEEPANADDFALNLVPAERRATLIAKRVPGGNHELEWNIRLQGKDETVFFDC